MNEQRIIRRALKDNPEALRAYNRQYELMKNLIMSAQKLIDSINESSEYLKKQKIENK